MYAWPNGSLQIPPVSSEWNPSRLHPVLRKRMPHNGIDLVGFPEVKAIGAGTVTFAGYNGTAGYEVRIVHNDGSEARYLHLTKDLAVTKGQTVQARTTLGRMGSTGLSTGVHLHLETRPRPGSPSVNPRDFMGAKPSFSAGKTNPAEHQEETVKIIAPYGSGVRGVVGAAFGYSFRSETDFIHFTNIHGLNRSAPFIVGDKKMGAKRAREIYDRQIEICREGSAPSRQGLNISAVTAAVKAALKTTPAAGDADLIAQQVAAALSSALNAMPAEVADEIAERLRE